jgi:multidrug efflux pump subunit AcrA (membrane-fusion protein)
MTVRLRRLAPAILILAPLGCGGRAEKTIKADMAPKAVPVTVAPIETRTVERTVDVVGSLKGWDDVTVGAKRTGRVVKVFHDMGDRVKPGEHLVELETVDADLSIEQSRKKLLAELAKLGLSDLPPKDFDVSKVPTVVQAKLELDRAKLNLSRERSLTHKGAGTYQDFQNAENDELAAEAKLDNAILTARSNLASAQAAKVALDVALQNRKDLEIRAPIPSAPPSGLKAPLEYAVSKRSASEGQMLKEGEAVAELVVENPLRLWANVPERYSAEIRLGQPVRISVASHPGRAFEGRVARINPSVDSSSRAFQVEVAIPNDDGLLRPGGFAKAQILTQQESDAHTVPLESVVRFAGVTKVFVLAEGNKVRAVPVETRLEGPGWIEVVGELPSQGRVVTTGQTQLADGTPVVIREPELAQSAAARAQ